MRFTDEQSMVLDAARTFLAETCSSDAVRAAMAMPQGFDPAVWQQMAVELGWAGLRLPDAMGGLGLDPLSLVLVQEQIGYHLVPSPFWGHGVVGACLLAGAQDSALADLGPSLAGGEQILSGAVADAGALRLDGGRLTGQLTRVAYADAADQFLVLLSDDASRRLVQVAAEAAVKIEAVPGWDESRRSCAVSFAQAPVTAEVTLAPEAAANCRAELAVQQAAEQLGGAQRCLDLTLAYIQERKQFGRAVGSFQAVKHRCAQMLVQVENARSIVYGAADGLGTDEAALDAAAAVETAAAAYKYCAGEAIQLHGGVGFTWEYDPQMYFKRAWSSVNGQWDADAARSRIAAALLDTEGQAA